MPASARVGDLSSFAPTGIQVKISVEWPGDVLHPLSMKLWIHFALLACLTACVPLPQTDFVQVGGARGLPHVGYHNGYFLVQASGADEPNLYRVVAEETYAIAPSGQRHAVVVEPHAWDLQQREGAGPAVRERVYLLGADGRRIRRLSHGPWRFFLTLDGPDGRRQWEFTSDVSTFLYSPVIHGPPN